MKKSRLSTRLLSFFLVAVLLLAQVPVFAAPTPSGLPAAQSETVIIGGEAYEKLYTDAITVYVRKSDGGFTVLPASEAHTFDPSKPPSHAVFHIDGQDYRYGDNVDISLTPLFVQPGADTDGVVESTWTLGDFVISQYIGITADAAREHSYAVQVGYAAQYFGGESADISARIVVDTRFGPHDALPATIVGSGASDIYEVGEVETEIAFIPAPHSAYGASGDGAKGFLLLCEEGYPAPAAAVFANFDGLASQGADYVIDQTRPITDSGVALCFDTVTLTAPAEGDETNEAAFASFSASYGFYDLEPVNPRATPLSAAGVMPLDAAEEYVAKVAFSESTPRVISPRQLILDGAPVYDDEHWEEVASGEERAFSISWNASASLPPLLKNAITGYRGDIVENATNLTLATFEADIGEAVQYTMLSADWFTHELIEHEATDYDLDGDSGLSDAEWAAWLADYDPATCYPKEISRDTELSWYSLGVARSEPNAFRFSINVEPILDDDYTWVTLIPAGYEGAGSISGEFAAGYDVSNIDSPVWLVKTGEEITLTMEPTPADGMAKANCYDDNCTLTLVERTPFEVVYSFTTQPLSLPYLDPVEIVMNAGDIAGSWRAINPKVFGAGATDAHRDMVLDAIYGEPANAGTTNYSQGLLFGAAGETVTIDLSKLTGLPGGTNKLAVYEAGTNTVVDTFNGGAALTFTGDPVDDSIAFTMPSYPVDVALELGTVYRVFTQIIFDGEPSTDTTASITLSMPNPQPWTSVIASASFFNTPESGEIYKLSGNLTALKLAADGTPVQSIGAAYEYDSGSTVFTMPESDVLVTATVVKVTAPALHPVEILPLVGGGCKLYDVWFGTDPWFTGEKPFAPYQVDESGRISKVRAGETVYFSLFRDREFDWYPENESWKVNSLLLKAGDTEINLAKLAAVDTHSTVLGNIEVSTAFNPESTDNSNFLSGSFIMPDAPVTLEVTGAKFGYQVFLNAVKLDEEGNEVSIPSISGVVATALPGEEVVIHLPVLPNYEPVEGESVELSARAIGSVGGVGLTQYTGSVLGEDVPKYQVEFPMLRYNTEVKVLYEEKPVQVVKFTGYEDETYFYNGMLGDVREGAYRVGADGTFTLDFTISWNWAGGGVEYRLDTDKLPAELVSGGEPVSEGSSQYTLKLKAKSGGEPIEIPLTRVYNPVPLPLPDIGGVSPNHINPFQFTVLHIDHSGGYVDFDGMQITLEDVMTDKGGIGAQIDSMTLTRPNGDKIEKDATAVATAIEGGTISFPPPLKVGEYEVAGMVQGSRMAINADFFGIFGDNVNESNAKDYTGEYTLTIGYSYGKDYTSTGERSVNFSLKATTFDPRVPFGYVAIVQERGTLNYHYIFANTEAELTAKAGQIGSILLKFYAEDGFSPLGYYDPSKDYELINYDRLFQTSGKVVMNDTVTYTPNQDGGLFQLSAETRYVTYKEPERLKTITSRDMAISSGGITLYDPQGGAEESQEIRGEIIDLVAYTSENAMPLNFQSNPTTMDITGVEGMSAEVGQIIMKDSTIEFSGKLQINVPGISGPFIRVELEKLVLGTNTDPYSFKEIAASGEVNIPNYFVFGGGGYANIDIKMKENPEDAWDVFERFEIGLGATVDISVAEIEGHLRLKRSERFTVPILDRFEFSLEGDEGIPLVPPVVVADLTGGMGGFDNLTSLADYDPREQALPNIELKAGLYFELLEIMKLKVNLSAGTFWIQTEFSGGFGVAGIDLEIVESLSQTVGFKDAGQHWNDYVKKSTPYAAYVIGSSIRLNILKGIVDDVIVAGGNVEVRAEFSTTAWTQLLADNIKKGGDFKDWLNPTKLMQALDVRLGVNGSLYGEVNVPGIGFFGPWTVGEAKVWLSASMKTAELFSKSPKWQNLFYWFEIAGHAELIGIVKADFEYDLTRPTEAPSFDVSLFSTSAANTSLTAGSGFVTVGDNLRTVADSDTPPALSSLSALSIAPLSLEEVKITKDYDGTAYTHTIDIPDDGNRYAVELTSYAGEPLDIRAYLPDGKALTIRPLGSNTEITQAHAENAYNALTSADGRAMLLSLESFMDGTAGDNSGESNLETTGKWQIVSTQPFKSTVIEAGRLPGVKSVSVSETDDAVDITFEHLETGKGYVYDIVLEKKGSTEHEAEAFYTLAQDTPFTGATAQYPLDADAMNGLAAGDWYAQVTLKEKTGKIIELEDEDGLVETAEYLDAIATGCALAPITIVNTRMQELNSEWEHKLSVTSGGNESLRVAFDQFDTSALLDAPELHSYRVTVYDENGNIASTSVMREENGVSTQHERQMVYSVPASAADESGHFEYLVLGVKVGQEYSVGLTPVFKGAPTIADEEIAQEAADAMPEITLDGIEATRSEKIEIPAVTLPDVKLTVSGGTLADHVGSDTKTAYAGENAVLTATTDEDCVVTIETYTGTLEVTDDDLQDAVASAALETLNNRLLLVTARNTTTGDTSSRLVQVTRDITAPTLMLDAALSAEAGAAAENAMQVLDETADPAAEDAVRVLAGANGDYMITGRTEPLRDVTAVGVFSVTADADGRFALPGILPDGTDSAEIMISVTDLAGNTEIKAIKVLRAGSSGVVVQSIAASPEGTVTLNKGDTLNMAVIATLSDGSKIPVSPDLLAYATTGAVTADENGVLTVTDEGEATVTASAAAGTLGTGSFVSEALTINGMTIVPVIATSALPNGKVGTAYAQTLTATGKEPITWTVDSGALPSGLTLSSDGVISGIPNSTGTFSFAVKATSDGVSATKALSIEINTAGGASAGGGDTTYTVTFDTDGGGQVPNQRISQGGKAAKPADPVKAGYTFAGWYSDKELLTEHDFNKAVTGNLTLYARWTEGEVQPPEWSNPFPDVAEGDWFYDDVNYVYTNDMFKGTSATTFAPNAPMSRAMLVTVLYRMAGEPDISGLENPFGDVPAGEWYTDAIVWAAENGIVTGYGDNLFGTNDSISRQDLCVMLLRYAQWAGIALPETLAAQDFADASEISSYAEDAVMALYRAGVIEGKGGGVFDPESASTRAETAAVLHRFLES